MSNHQDWLSSNDRYLASALQWLRGRLERLGGGDQRPALKTKAPAAMAKASVLDMMPAFSAALKTAEVHKPPQTRAKGAEAGDPALPPKTNDDQAAPALILLSRQLGLSPFETRLLFLCTAMELDTGLGTLCASAMRDMARPYPTFGLAFALFDEPAWDVMSPERPLRYLRLIEINQPGAQPLIGSALKADERIVNYIKGLNYLDDRLAPLMQRVMPSDTPLPPSQMAMVDLIENQFMHAQPGGSLPAAQLLGSDSASKLAVAGQVAARLGLMLYRLAADAIPAAAGDNETFVRLWQRETALLPLALYIDAADHGGAAQSVRRFLDRSSGVAFLDTREAWADLGAGTISVDVSKPTPGEQQAAWLAALGVANGEIAGRLSGQFDLNGAVISAVAANAMAASADEPAGLDAALWQGCLNHARPALDQLAHAIVPRAQWENIELPAPERDLLRQIAAQVKSRRAVYDDWGFRGAMNRGLGISVLFAGESGTGKTMAAEVIARDLGLLLYRIDLSGVVSKFIGETEKNLRKLFDAAEDGGAILFFDEADALFGKRSEVKDSHDRYANIEINYLLQRMESYRGLAILATNMKASLDQAFLRRLRFIVNFPFPGAAQRLGIWQKAFPPQTPVADIDHARLSRLNLTGGSIHNIALNAAFLAAGQGSAVTMPLILESARAEFRKLEKPVNEADFRWLESVGGAA